VAWRLINLSTLETMNPTSQALQTIPRSHSRSTSLSRVVDVGLHLQRQTTEEDLDPSVPLPFLSMVK
jgi:hypothetical protein